MSTKEMRGFEDLECYQLALKALDEAYSVARQLPGEERFNLADQIRRAAVSVTLNIAEGYGRFHYLDTLRFLYIARGSLTELLSALIVCERLHFVNGRLDTDRQLCNSALRSLNGYIRYIREQQQGQSEFGRQALHEEAFPYALTWSGNDDCPNNDRSTDLPIYQSTDSPRSL
jgi:four helix bundle protein